MSGVGNDVPGAGVDPAKVINGRKRLKKMHRASEGDLSFKAFVRALAKNGDAYAKAFLFHKSAAFTAEARKARKDKVRAAQLATRKAPGEKFKRKNKGKGK
jgi:hypothetical protein